MVPAKSAEIGTLEFLEKSEFADTARAQGTECTLFAGLPKNRANFGHAQRFNHKDSEAESCISRSFMAQRVFFSDKKIGVKIMTCQV